MNYISLFKLKWKPNKDTAYGFWKVLLDPANIWQHEAALKKVSAVPENEGPDILDHYRVEGSLPLNTHSKKSKSKKKYGTQKV